MLDFSRWRPVVLDRGFEEEFICEERVAPRALSLVPLVVVVSISLMYFLRALAIFVE